MIYFIYDNIETLFSTNSTENITQCCMQCPKDIHTIKQECKILKRIVRSGWTTNSSGFSICLCCDEAPDSKRVWKNNVSRFLELIPSILAAKKQANSEAAQGIDRLLHNLKKFNAHCIQISDFFLDSYQSRSNNNNQIDAVKRIVLNNPDKAAAEFLKMIKNIRLTQAEISVFDRLYKSDSISLRPAIHQAHRIVNSVYRLFADSFAEARVRISLSESFHEVFVDYETFTVALTHLIDNMAKYIMPHSDGRIYFEDHENRVKIVFAMTSLQIKEDELEDIFKENYSGYFSTQMGLKGDGIGMFIRVTMSWLSEHYRY